MNATHPGPETHLIHLQEHFREIHDQVAHYLDPQAHPTITHASSWPVTVTQLAKSFDLSPFEQRILILCAAQELSSDFAQLLEAFNPAMVTFNLAMAVLPEPHWSACTLMSPLRQYHLIHLMAGNSLVNRGLKLDERLLISILGISNQNGLFSEYFTRVAAPEPGSFHAETANDIAQQWLSAPGQPQAVLLTGGEAADRERIAAAAAQQTERVLFCASLDNLPQASAAFDDLMRHLEREHRLAPIALLLHDFDGDAVQQNLAKRILSKPEWFVIVSQDRRLAWRGTRSVVHINLPFHSHETRVAMWQELAGDILNHEQASHLANHFGMGRSAMENIRDRARAKSTTANDSANPIWELAKQQARPDLENLAICVTAQASMDQLVLPKEKKKILRQISAQVRQRYKVHDIWGFGGESKRGLGVSALFHGISGTGKTLAAEAIAHDLALDLYHVDLSAIVSKYIGETEKNLARVFDTAERGGAVLFFDEADALFGKRSKIRDSHDRFANIQVSYLLQRLESYRGLAVLATNDKSGLDPAFTRRLKFIIEFPFPDINERCQIWQRMFPINAPIANLDFQKLAQLKVTGGHIHAIALQAAFHAAEENAPIQMQHLLQAARIAYQKIGKRITPAEIGNWVEAQALNPYSEASP